MNIIKERKIKSGVVNFLLYLSFCLAGWYSARTSVAVYMSAYASSVPMLSVLNNEFTAFFIAGVVPFAIYIVVVKAFMSILKHTPFLPVNEIFYALPFFYIGANIVTGLFNIWYYVKPIASIWGSIIVPLVSTACFFIWFLAFICKNYIKNYNWKAIVLYFGRLYLFIALLLTGMGLLVEVLL
ncbi:MAG: hypothetical protein J1F36_04790 [Clostridiales bacterium]|nr:hypothetical protein [Clostridiales bacterium]